MDNLAALLGSKKFEEPAEIAAIKRYVQEHYKSVVGVLVRDDKLVIVAPSASLINTLRLEAVDLSEACHLTQKLIFRIGTIPS